MKRSLSSSPTGLLASLRIFSSCSVTHCVEFFWHWSIISSFTSSTHCTPCKQRTYNLNDHNITQLVSNADGPRWFYLPLCKVQHGDESKHFIGIFIITVFRHLSLLEQSKGMGYEWLQRDGHLHSLRPAENGWATHFDDTTNVTLLNDDVSHLWCIDMRLQEELFPHITDVTSVRPRSATVQ